MKKSLPYLTALVCVAIAATSLAQPAQRSETGSHAIAQTRARSGSDAISQRRPPERSEQARTARAERNLSDADRFLLQAIDRLEQQNSLYARLSCRAAINGVEIEGAGKYWQQGQGTERRVRLELKMMSHEDASLLQVSNGRFLWTDRRLPSGRSVTRVNLDTLRAETQPGSNQWPGGGAVAPFLLAESGGLPGLLASLHENFTFQPPQSMRLELRHSPAVDPTELAVYALVGRWKPERLAALAESQESREKSQESRAESQEPEVASEQTPALDAPDSLPPRFPHEVLLLFGQADLFPYRIEYRRLKSPQAAGGASAFRLSTQPLVVLELSDVTPGAAISPGQFDYASGDAAWSDQTAATLERLRGQQMTR